MQLEKGGLIEVERDFSWSSAPTPHIKQGHPEPAAHDCIQIALKCLQGWRFHSLYGCLVPELGYPHSKKVLSHVPRESPVFHLVPIAACPVSGHQQQEPVAVCFLFSFSCLYTLVTFKAVPRTATETAH